MDTNTHRLPWRLRLEQRDGGRTIEDRDGHGVTFAPVFNGSSATTVAEAASNAALIVRSVNKHDALVEAVIRLIAASNATPFYARPHEAIAFAYSVLVSLSASGERGILDRLDAAMPKANTTSPTIPD